MFAPFEPKDLSNIMKTYLIFFITYHSRALRNAEFLKVQACEQNSEVSQNTRTYFGFKTTSTIVLHIYLPIVLKIVLYIFVLTGIIWSSSFSYPLTN